MVRASLVAALLLLSASWAMAQTGGTSNTGNQNVYSTGSSGAPLSPDVNQAMTGTRGQTTSGALAQSGAGMSNPNNSMTTGTNVGVSPNGPNSTANGMGMSSLAEGGSPQTANPDISGAPTVTSKGTGKGCGVQSKDGTPAYVQGGTICGGERQPR